jgi:glycosyltransferase involved in cell wall biosynthesis
MADRQVLLISAHFLPSNLAGVQRVRVMSRALKDYGWSPIIVTVDYRDYEELPDLSSLQLLPSGVRVETVRAWPAALCRALGFGDTALRGQWALRRRVEELIHARRPSVIFATVLPGYTSLVGAWAKRRFNIPFVLDYQDPWVPKRDREGEGSVKRKMADTLARRLEPKAVRAADAITAVSDETLDSLRERDLVRADQPVEIIPIGADWNDHAVAQQYGTSLITPAGDVFHIAYLGTLTERMLPALKAFLAGAAKAQDGAAKRLAIHLIGTSAQPNGQDQHNLTGLVEEAGLNGKVFLHPGRVGYLDALRTMQNADLLILLGSTDSHYTASKLFPYWLSGKPIFGLFHRASTIVELGQKLGGVKLVTYDALNGPDSCVPETAAFLHEALEGRLVVAARNEESFAPYSAEGVAARFAEVFGKVAKACV